MKGLLLSCYRKGLKLKGSKHGWGTQKDYLILYSLDSLT